MLPGLDEQFSYRRGVLCAEGVELAGLAERFGTPLYVYSRQAIVDRYRELARAFPAPRCRVLFSVKSNGNLSLLKLLHGLGAGLDVVSGGELYRARRAGFDGRDIVFAGVGKTDEEIAMAIKLGVSSLNVESLPELERVNALAVRLGRRAAVSLRINPDIAADTHHYITTGRIFNKFGLPLAVALQAARGLERMRGVKMRGLHFHIGSQITDVRPYHQTAVYARRCWLEFARLGLRLETINLGGGFGISYDGRRVPKASQFAKAVWGPLRRDEIRLLVEPGRYIVAPAALLLTKVVYRKEGGRRVFLIADAGMSDLLRPALYSAYHHVLSATERRGRQEIASLVGPICESGDFFARDRRLPRLAAGELVAVTGAGAYGSAMASNYNTRPRAAEVLVDGRRAVVIRRREKYEDLVRAEI